jgi:hypothetical protein
MSMGWVHWVLVVLLALGPIISASNVGKPRKPLTPGDAAGKRRPEHRIAGGSASLGLNK